MKKILICGTIGSGKSIICSILRHLGFSVYDCDTEAKRLMNECGDLREELCLHFGNHIYNCNGLDRNRLASIVFNDPERLNVLNTLVHSRVRSHLARWFDEREQTASLLFVETAIPVTAGIDIMVDEAWNVEAPRDLKIERLAKFRSIPESEFDRRDSTQANEKPRCTTWRIFNDTRPLLPQVMTLLEHSRTNTPAS